MAAQRNSRYFPRLVAEPVEVFPPTKPPPISVPRLTVQQRAKQGARFLRTYHPDVDIPFELIKDELQLDEKQAIVDSELDPYAGNHLVHFSMVAERKHPTPFLAFPCGVTGSELNVSPFRLTRDKKYSFCPSATPTMSFDTPIQQIVTFLPKETTFQKISLLAVRAHAVVSVLKLQSNARCDLGDAPVVAETVIPISVSETGKRRIVDMSFCSFSSSNPQLLLVNDVGAVYNCQIEGGSKTLSSPPDMPVKEDLGLDHFWRLAWRDAHACMRASSKRVHLLDFRTRTTQPQELFSLTDIREYVTSLEAPSDGRHTMCFSTTSKILWYDTRNSKRPVLSIKHQRAFDRSLCIGSIKSGLSTLTTLSSAANHLVTVYDVNYASSGHLQLHDLPSLLPGASALDLPVIGSLCFQLPDQEDQGYYHFQLSSRGSLWKTNVNFSEVAEEQPGGGPENFQWTDEMHALGKKGKTMTEYIGKLEGREHIVADLRGIYEKIYDVERDPTQATQEDAEAIYQTLDKMPFSWQDMNGIAENMLITFDVAFQSGSEPVHASRADFLTESLLSTARGFMALMRGRIPIPRLVYTAPWSHDLASLPFAIVPNMRVPSQTLFDTLRAEAMAQASTPQGMQRATEAAQNLVLDLALSRHVYAPRPFSKTCIDTRVEADGTEMLSRATKALSLGTTGPSASQLGFLRPIARVTHEDGEHMESEDDLNSDGKLKIPWGVRLLLSKWDVGSSPEDYSYIDPYEGEAIPVTDRTPAADRRGTHIGTVRSTQHDSIPTIVTVTASRPPTVFSTLSRHVLTSQSRPPTWTASMLESHVVSESLPARQQPHFLTDENVTQMERQGNTRWDSNSSPQDLLGPSTQPLPGPFGGGSRILGARKKVVKKRMGGF